MRPEEARRLGLKEYVSDLPCKRGHTSPRNTRTSICKECSRIHRLERYASKPWFVSHDKFRRAMPRWVSVEEIRSIYEKSRALTAETGQKWEVDHIVPLNGKNVCGLHVPWNLRIIPHRENHQKSNAHESDVFV